jgi:hypothetical protein
VLLNFFIVVAEESNVPKLAEVQNHTLISVNNDDVSEREEYNFTWGSVADYET